MMNVIGNLSAFMSCLHVSNRTQKELHRCVRKQTIKVNMPLVVHKCNASNSAPGGPDFQAGVLINR